MSITKLRFTAVPCYSSVNMTVPIFLSPLIKAFIVQFVDWKISTSLPSVDKHVGNETPGLLPALGLVGQTTVPDAFIQGHPLLLRLPHRVVDKHRQLKNNREWTHTHTHIKRCK